MKWKASGAPRVSPGRGLPLRIAGSLAGAGASHNNYFYWLSTSASNMSMLFLQIGGRPRGTAVGLISPGSVDSDMNRAWRHGALPPPSLLTPA